MRSSRTIVVTVAFVALAVSCVGAKLSSTEQPVVAILDPTNLTLLTTYDFGPVSGSATHDFQIGPSSSSDDDILQNIGFQNLCPDFTISTSMPPLGYEICTTPILATGLVQLCENFPFSITFAPQSAGFQSCLLVVNSMPHGGGPANPPLTFAVSGTGALPFAFDVGPTTLNFGTVSTAPSFAETFSVQNTGLNAISISESSPTSAYQFTPPLTTLMLDPGAKQSYSVTCSPALGVNPAVVTFSAAGIPDQTLTLSCTGTSTKLTADPLPIDFGRINAGSTVAPIHVSLHNTGATTLDISGIALANGASPNVGLQNVTSMISLPAGQTAMNAFTVTYSPVTPEDFGPLGSVTLVASGSVIEFPITGGLVSAAIGTTPPSVDLGPVCPNHSASANVGVYATGKADVMVSLDPANPPAPPFAATLPSAVVHGNHADATTLVVSVATRATDLGDLHAQVALDTTIPSEPMHLLDVSALAVPPGINATPSAVDFGERVKDTTSEAKRIDFSNCSGSVVLVTSASISGPDASSFSIASPQGNAAMALDDGKSETFLIVMTAHSAGTKVAQLDIVNNGAGGAISVPLTGIGTAPQVDRQSYYACSTSGGGASWPIGGAVVALTVGRRRRRCRAIRHVARDT